MPPDAALKLMNTVHRVMITASGGRLGRSVSGMPVVELTTTGRKSGQPRTSMLTSPLQEGDRTYIVASRGGDDRHPAWFLNLKANPEVRAKIGSGPTKTMRAEVLGDDERARVWPLITAEYRNYAGYQEKTSRQIPVVALLAKE